jgi:tRNA(Ile)-lysidine synthase
MCSKKGISFYGFQLNEFPEKNKESAWRTARKKFSSEVKKDFGADRILTAHHATDLAETILFRLTKGCGIAGMAPFDLSTKPFWQIPKRDLEAYAKVHRIKFTSDPSNDSLAHERNIIRHSVLPHLRTITPNLEKVFVKEAQIFSEMEQFVSSTVEGLIPKTEKMIPLSEFLSWPVILQKGSLRSIAGNTLSFEDTADCLRWLCGKPKGGSKKIIGKIELRVARGELRWSVKDN